MGKNSERLELIQRYTTNVSRFITKNRIKLTKLEGLFVYQTKHTKFNNLYAEVIVNYKLDKR
jgi:hypothetical protein